MFTQSNIKFKFKLDNDSKTIISEHITSLDEYFSFNYLERMDSADLRLLRNPFTISPPQAISDTNGRAQDELIDHIHDESAKELFERAVLSTIWCLMEDSYLLSINNILTNLLSFPTTHLCESGFSTTLQIKTSSRNKLKVEDDLRCALTKTEPKFRI